MGLIGALRLIGLMRRGYHSPIVPIVPILPIVPIVPIYPILPIFPILSQVLFLIPVLWGGVAWRGGRGGGGGGGGYYF